MKAILFKMSHYHIIVTISIIVQKEHARISLPFPYNVKTVIKSSQLEILEQF